MKYIIKNIRLELAMPARSYESALDLVPATGALSRTTSEDGLTEVIEVSALLPWNRPVPETINADLSNVSVEYIDEEAGASFVFSFGSADLPARFLLEETATRMIRCKYTRAI